jgi:hypothetical protein
MKVLTDAIFAKTVLAVGQCKEFIDRFFIIANAAGLFIGTRRLLHNCIYYLLTLFFNQILLLEKFSLVK